MGAAEHVRGAGVMRIPRLHLGSRKPSRRHERIRRQPAQRAGPVPPRTEVQVGGGDERGRDVAERERDLLAHHERGVEPHDVDGRGDADVRQHVPELEGELLGLHRRSTARATRGVLLVPAEALPPSARPPQDDGVVIGGIHVERALHRCGEDRRVVEVLFVFQVR